MYIKFLFSVFINLHYQSSRHLCYTVIFKCKDLYIRLKIYRSLCNLPTHHWSVPCGLDNTKDELN